MMLVKLRPQRTRCVALRTRVSARKMALSITMFTLRSKLSNQYAPTSLALVGRPGADSFEVT